MGKRTSRAATVSGRTAGGHVRDRKVERIGPVTIYKRGNVYYLYYRESGETKRPRIDGNLAVARATAHDVAKALAIEQLSPFSFQRTSPQELVAEYLQFVEETQRRAWRTCQRYRAALERWLDFMEDRGYHAIDNITVSHVEELVRWLRGQTRCRNGAKTGKKDAYKAGGIKFILSTCRTAFNWAARNRRLPPYAQNPFSQLPTDMLGDDNADDLDREVFTPSQEKSFFRSCSPWQRSIFVPLAGYGLRVGELTHLLIENVDFPEGVVRIRSKPELFWRIKTRDRRDLPLTGPMGDLFRQLIGSRRAGFVFLNKPYFDSTQQPAEGFATGL